MESGSLQQARTILGFNLEFNKQNLVPGGRKISFAGFAWMTYESVRYTLSLLQW